MEGGNCVLGERLGCFATNGMLGKKLVVMPFKTPRLNQPGFNIEVKSFKCWGR